MIDLILSFLMKAPIFFVLVLFFLILFLAVLIFFITKKTFNSDSENTEKEVKK